MTASIAYYAEITIISFAVMPRIATPLTDSRIREAAPVGKPVKLADGEGMYLLVRPDGSRYWRLDYRFDGRRKTLALGVYPHVGLDEARQRRAEARSLLAKGIDPGEERKARKTLRRAASSGGGGLRDIDVERDRLISIFEATPDFVGISDGDGNVLYVNRAGREMVGLGDTPAAEIRIPDVHPPRAGEMLLTQAIPAAIRDGSWSGDNVLRGKDGGEIPVSQVLVCHRDAAGRPLYLSTIMRDISTHMRVEAALRESESRFRLLLDASPEAIFGVDAEGICTFVNPACLQMLGYEQEEMLGRSVHALIHHTHADGSPYPKAHCHIRKSTLLGQPTHVDSEVHWRKDGSSFPVEYWSHPLYEDGKLVGAVVTFVDISERKRMERALRENEERYRLISSVATDLLYSCVLTSEGTFAVDWATASVDHIFGYSLQEILERRCWRCFVHPEDLPEFDRNISSLEPGQRSECELRIIAKDGSTRYIHAYSMVVEDTGHRHRLYGACQDVTDRRRAEEALRESEVRFRTMAEHSADWIWSMDAQGRHTYSNQRGASILDYPIDEFLALDPATLVHPDDLLRFRDVFRKALSSQHGWQNVILRWRHRDGSYRTLESSASPCFDEQKRLVGFQGVDRDITERQQAEERIQFLAHHDALTGLPNRILLRDRFEQALAMADRAKTHVALLFLDLDNFKVVNDTLGHAAGDELLVNVVKRLARCTRDSDTISRQGGDEFILLLHDIPDMEAVERVAGEILARLAEPMEIQGHVLNLSCSIGIAIHPEDGLDFEVLMQRADTAMYTAKDAGRNTYRFFDDEMNLRAREHLLLQNRLHQALAQGQFRLHYQPQLEVSSGRVTGVEALLRWHHPDLGHVPPSRFIPVAEDSGLIVPIGEWVLQEACRQAQAWRQAGLGELAVSVNLSALQFRRSNLVQGVAHALHRSGLPAALLELELTESILLQDVENTLETVRQLKALGVRLSIDDFGTGYSSLSYLKRFAVDRLKIDQSFVRDIGTDPDGAAIVRAIIQLARSLRLGIIAEGVETTEQLSFLKEEGCQEVQGYLFSRPLPVDELEAFMRRRAAGNA